jgi:hypothetical protein
MAKSSHTNRTLNLRTGTIAGALSCAIEDHRRKRFRSQLPAQNQVDGEFFDHIVWSWGDEARLAIGS